MEEGTAMLSSHPLLCFCKQEYSDLMTWLIKTPRKLVLLPDWPENWGDNISGVEYVQWNPYYVDSLKSGHLVYRGTPLEWPPLGNEILALIEGWPYLRGWFVLKKVHLGLSKVAFIEGWPPVRGGLYEGFHCNHFEPYTLIGHLSNTVNSLGSKERKYTV